VDGRRQVRLVPFHIPLGKALELFLHGDAPFDAGQRRADAGVYDRAGAQLRTLFPAQVETLPIGVAPLVAIRGADQEKYGAACGYFLAIELGVTRDIAPDVRPRRLVAQDLLDRVGDRRRCLDQVASLIRLIRMLREHVAEDEHFVARGPTPRAELKVL